MTDRKDARTMSRRPLSPRSLRPALVVATVLAGVLALAGCSAGAVTQTDTTVTGVNGAMGQTGEMLVRDLIIDPGPAEVVPAGATVSLRGTFVNEAPGGDRLVSITTPYAGAVNVTGTTAIPGDNATRMVGSEPGPVGPPAPVTRLTGTMRVLLPGVTQVLHSGPTYPITFVFERAGSVTVPAPVITQGPVPAS